MEAPPEERRVFELLRRADKYYLGAGDGVIFAPPLPQHLDQPGFWDGVHYYLFSLRPAFTITLVSSSGRGLSLQLRSRHWTPAELSARYRSGELDLRERRVLLPGGRIISEWSITNRGENTADFSLVAWSAQEGADLRERAAVTTADDAVCFRVTMRDAQLRGMEMDTDVTLRLAGGRGSCVSESQHPRAYPNLPAWELTPFAERWLEGRLHGGRRLAPAPPGTGRTLVFLGVSLPLRLEPGETQSAQAVLTLSPVDHALRLPAAELPPPGQAAQRSNQAWLQYFQDAPALAASDPWLEHYFPYRWYGLRLNFLDPAGDYAHPTVAEGIEFFHDAVSYSAWCHLRELRWLPDPARARGTLRAFLQRQRPDGSLPGILYLRGEHPTAHYIADWGGSLQALDEVHPDRAFLEECYGPLARYAAHARCERDPEGSGMYDVRDPYETGQETMSRYTAVDPAADRQHFDYRLRLKGIDCTIYMYRLERELARVAAALGLRAEMRAHDQVADRIAEAVRNRMWDPQQGLFSDVDPATGCPTGIKAAVCFYPYLTDIVEHAHTEGLQRHLFDATSFWLPYPVPSTAADDATFSAHAEWQGVRQNCTWNGRIWPMTNSHLVEALGQVATSIDPGLRPRTVELFTSYLRMLFFDGDPARPNCFEHYSPLSGRPCQYRGIDDYQHSWINDLIIRYVVGFRPAAEGFIVDPFPFDVSFLRLSRLPFRGHVVTIELEEGQVRVLVDQELHESRNGEPLRVVLP